jgi:RNA polymerase sigma-70 factor (ECF subfamily)
MGEPAVAEGRGSSQWAHRTWPAPPGQVLHPDVEARRWLTTRGLTDDAEHRLNQLAAAASGDLRVRARLLTVVQSLALRYCRARLQSDDDALCSPEDIAQDVCIAVLGALPTYRPEGRSFRAFVFGITKHKIVDAYRASRRGSCSPVAEPPDPPVQADGPEQRLLSVERSEYVGRLLATLPAHQRQVLGLRVVVGLSAEETSRIVGGRAAAVRLTQHRALNRLRQTLN